MSYSGNTMAQKQDPEIALWPFIGVQEWSDHQENAKSH